jgi:hypothetical protein
LLGRRSLDQALRQTELRSQCALATSHAARIGFVIVARQVEQAVEHQYLKLCFEGVAAHRALPPRRLHADSQIARNFLFFLVLELLLGWEREHIGRFVLTAINTIEAANRAIGGQEHADFATQPNSGPGTKEETSQGTSEGTGLTERRGTSPGGWGVRLQIWVEEDHLAQNRSWRTACIDSDST